MLLTTQDKPISLETQRYWCFLEGMEINDGVKFLQKEGIEEAAAELEDFVTYVDGHPLTLKLIAGYLRSPRNTQLSAIKQEFEIVYKKAKGPHRDKPKAFLSWILDKHLKRLKTKQCRSFWENLSVYRQPFDENAAGWMFTSEQELATETDIEEELIELFNRSLLQQTKDNKYQFLSLVQRYIQQKAKDLTDAHNRAIEYYKSNRKEQPWKTIEDVTEYLEVFYHLCQLKVYSQAYDILNDCYTFLDRQCYIYHIIELYEQLVNEWHPNSTYEEQSKLAQSLINLGVAYRLLEEYQQSIEYYRRSLRIAHKINNIDLKIGSLTNRRNVHLCLKEDAQANSYDRLIENLLQSSSDPQNLAINYGNKGLVYLNKARDLSQLNLHPQVIIEYCEKAIEELDKILAIANQIDICEEIILNTLANKGAAYALMKNHDRAIDFYDRALLMSRNSEFLQL